MYKNEWLQLARSWDYLNQVMQSVVKRNYTENQKLPDLQYLADRLYEDDEMQYVIKKEKDIASLEKIDVSNVDSIFTKMKKYPYEFEINGQLQLASINGVKVANKETILEGYIKPEGTKSITENGENIDVREL